MSPLLIMGPPVLVDWGTLDLSWVSSAGGGWAAGGASAAGVRLVTGAVS